VSEGYIGWVTPESTLVDIIPIFGKWTKQEVDNHITKKTNL